MNGDNPINVFEPQFSQREAAEIAGVPMTAINNWLKRGAFKLEGDDGDQERRRRFFSIAGISRLHVMRFCTEHLELSPEAAAVAATGVNEYFAGEKREITDEDGTFFEVWHWAHRAPDHLGGERRWRTQGVWQEPTTGAFYTYHPGLFSDEEPGGPPHFPCVCIPTSQLARRIFLACADRLMADHQDEDAPVNAERPSTVTAPGASAPGQHEDD
ncbi:hypothetical protein [Sphingomonas sp.]|uniref:hypothetical protein n=1 Tax=Sphingomonas sp. TaxID=28214 RepID=UPI003B00EB31